MADSALSVVVGTPRPADLKLMDVTAEALDAGIAAAVVGNKIGDISAAIGDVAHAAGLSVNTDFGGHGVGRVMHGDPHIPNDGRRKRGLPLRAGLVFAIEPWFMLGTDEIYTDRRRLDAALAQTARAARTSSTRSPSRTTGRSCSALGRSARRTPMIISRRDRRGRARQSSLGRHLRPVMIAEGRNGRCAIGAESGTRRSIGDVARPATVAIASASDHERPGDDREAEGVPASVVDSGSTEQQRRSARPR